MIEAIRANRLDQMIHCPFRNCALCVFGLVGGRDAKWPHRVSRQPQDIKSGHIGQRQVDKHHIGCQILDSINGGTTRADFPNDVQIGYLMAQVRESTARRRLLVDNKKP